MSTLAEMPQVSECTVAGCSYNNHSACHAGAVTIGGHGAAAQCATFIPLNVKGGLDTVLASVGACQRADCAFNENLSCTASEVRVGAAGDLADCLTYTAR